MQLLYVLEVRPWSRNWNLSKPPIPEWQNETVTVPTSEIGFEHEASRDYTASEGRMWRSSPGLFHLKGRAPSTTELENTDINKCPQSQERTTEAQAFCYWMMEKGGIHAACGEKQPVVPSWKELWSQRPEIQYTEPLCVCFFSWEIWTVTVPAL